MGLRVLDVTDAKVLTHADTFLSSLVAWFGGRLLSRTGEQIYLVDSYSDADTRPLLEVMADPSELIRLK